MRRVEEFMTAGPQVIRSSLPLREAGERMKECGVHHLPVVEGGDLVGLLTADDLRAYDECSELVRIRLRVEDVMIPMPYSVPSTAPLREVVKTMIAERYSATVVRNDAGQIAGVFTLRDALSALGELLEESEGPALRPGTEPALGVRACETC